ncbi:MAG: hypothetical protein M3258_06140 [Thermoproteota archaeon]|nr:hypothetical protein [Thermoproteota archaeon]
MPKRNFRTLEEFQANIHKEGATLVEFSGTKVPCILLDQKNYEQLLLTVYGKKVRADTMLDIFYDRQNVFVDIQIKFLDTKLEQNFLLYANDMIEFFEALAESGMISIASNSPVYTNSQNLFMIQLPKKEAAERALEIIKTKFKKHS